MRPECAFPRKKVYTFTSPTHPQPDATYRQCYPPSSTSFSFPACPYDNSTLRPPPSSLAATLRGCSPEPSLHLPSRFSQRRLLLMPLLQKTRPPPNCSPPRPSPPSPPHLPPSSTFAAPPPHLYWPFHFHSPTKQIFCAKLASTAGSAAGAFFRTLGRMTCRSKEGK